ncbi:beta-glucuronidase-like [Tropilaelaps mercedesae]|uniref:Beta-glucuronidase-like n=1 Tax=Tropilaelaps mercedesae TaxID=418985 RepID=A0A1V9X9P4_9ACAR|nr:beta-glucuronidase-like [Tropilaelaps mercedesae]
MFNKYALWYPDSGELETIHNPAFDYPQTQGWFIGEHVWNVADFMTAQILRCRCHALAGGKIAGDPFYCPAGHCSNADEYPQLRTV